MCCLGVLPFYSFPLLKDLYSCSLVSACQSLNVVFCRWCCGFVVVVVAVVVVIVVVVVVVVDFVVAIIVVITVFSS